MKVTIVGTGYGGLFSCACLAEVGNKVLCLDLDSERIHILDNGDIAIHEPGLQEMVLCNVAAGRQKFTIDMNRAVAHGTLQFIAVGIVCTILVWIRLTILIRNFEQTVYRFKRRLLDDDGCQQLKNQTAIINFA